MKLIDSETYRNLARAYASECMARTRYEFISYNAYQEQYVEISNIIGEIVHQEFTHARMLYTFIQTADEGTIDNVDISAGFPFREKWNFLDNLRLAAEDESNEIEAYERFAKVADKEGFSDIAGLFRNLIVAENAHKGIFKQLYEQLKSGSLYKKDNEVVWKCADCGYEQKSKSAFAECPLCQAKQGAVEVKTTFPECVSCI